MDTNSKTGRQIFQQTIRDQHNYLVLDVLGRGQSLNECGVILQQASPYTIEVCTNKAILFKIKRTSFLEKFGDLQGLPASKLHAIELMKRNWLQMKTQFLTFMNPERIAVLEFRDENEYSRHQAKEQQLNEVAYQTLFQPKDVQDVRDLEEEKRQNQVDNLV